MQISLKKLVWLPVGVRIGRRDWGAAGWTVRSI